MKQYVDDDPDEDWSESFWQIKLYTAEDLHDRPRAQASLIFAATMTGDLAFLSDRRNQRTPHQSIDHLLWNNSKHFCANGEVFYTPWSPGDIIKIDSRPFDHGPRFAIVLEDDYDSSFKSQVWCAYPSKIYGVEEGNLRLRDFTDGFLDDFTPSALYTAERYIGDLPDDCSFMLELSKKLHDDPSYGKQWSDGSVVHDCLQPYRISAGAGANTIRSDILEFLDSPDIREHLDGIGYEPTTPEAAFIVDRSSEKTLHQKIEAWQKILENMPNCAMNRRYGTFNIPNFHVFLRDVIRWERKKIARFKQPGKHMYFFEDKTGSPHESGCNYGPYTSYEKCFEAIWNELEGENPTSIEVTRRPIDPDEDYYAADKLMLDANGKVMDCQLRCIDKEREGEDPTFAFALMWFGIPTHSTPATSFVGTATLATPCCFSICRHGPRSESWMSFRLPPTGNAPQIRPTTCSGTIGKMAIRATCTPTAVRLNIPWSTPSISESRVVFFSIWNTAVPRSNRRREFCTACGHISTAIWVLTHLLRYQVFSSCRRWSRKKPSGLKEKTAGSSPAIRSCSITR